MLYVDASAAETRPVRALLKREVVATHTFEDGVTLTMRAATYEAESGDYFALPMPSPFGDVLLAGKAVLFESDLDAGSLTHREWQARMRSLMQPVAPPPPSPTTSQHEHESDLQRMSDVSSTSSDEGG
jgi:hypothetical protein